MLLFVDDTQTYSHDIIDRINCTIEKLNVDAASLVNWTKNSGLQLNANKTQAIILGSNHNLNLLKQMDVAPIIVDNLVIQFADSVKNLGLNISSNLKWDEQIANIITRTNKALYFMFSKCQSLTIHLKKQIAAQLLFPQFDYACLNFMDLTNEQETNLQKQLNKAVRFIFKLRKHEHITPFIKKLNWLPLVLRRKYFILTQTHKVLKSKKPVYLYKLLEPHLIFPNDSIQTRSKDTFKIPCKTKKVYDYSFCMMAMKAWNELPITIRNIDKLDTFKNTIKKLLLDNYKSS